MKITIDAQPLLGQKCGVGYYISGLVHGLGQIDKKNEYRLSIFDFKRRASKIALPGPNFKIQKSLIPGRLASLVWKKYSWPSYNSFFGVSDVYHFPNFIIRPLKKGKKVVTIHDVSFLRHPEFTEPKNLRFLNSKIKETVGLADRIIVDSSFTKNELLSFFKMPEERVHVVHLGLDSRFIPSSVEKKPIILFVGTIEPRKNLKTLFKAFEIFLDRTKRFDFTLLIAGMKGWLYDGIFKSLENNLHRDKIKFLDYVSEEELPSLYQTASLFVYPSFYEGFGLPPLEAMACGIPVISSKSGSLPEVLGNAAEWMDSSDVGGLALAIEKILDNASISDAYVRKGIEQVKQFRWERAAEETVKIYHRAMNGT